MSDTRSVDDTIEFRETVEYVRRKKTDLEHEIAVLLEDFTEDTSIEIVYVEIEFFPPIVEKIGNGYIVSLEGKI